MDDESIEMLFGKMLEMNQELDRKVNAIGAIAVRADSMSVPIAKLCIATVTALAKSGAIKGDALSELTELAHEITRAGAS